MKSSKSNNSFEEKHIQNLIDALAKTDEICDVNELKKQLQSAHNQILILKEKHKSFIDEISRLRKTLINLNKEKVQARKQTFEVTYQRDINDFNLKSVQNTLAKVQSELKAKNFMLAKLGKEEENRKIRENQIAIPRLTPSNLSIINASSRSSSKLSLIGDATPTTSKDDKSDKIHENEKKLLKNGLVEAYLAGRNVEEIDKILTLQRLLLEKVKEIAEKDVRIEEWEKKYNEMMQHLVRLRKTKHLAEELTNSRHKLNIKGKQLEAIKLELTSIKEKVARLMNENQSLKRKLTDIYENNKFK